MTLDEMVKALDDRNLVKVSEATGVSYQTIRNIAIGKTLDPSISVFKKIEQYLVGGKNAGA